MANMNPIISKTCYLIVGCALPGEWRTSLTVRITSKIPTLKAEERAIKLNLALPRALFQTPTLIATIAVPDSDVTPQELQAEVMESITAAMESVQGVRMTVNIVSPEAE